MSPGQSLAGRLSSRTVAAGQREPVGQFRQEDLENDVAAALGKSGLAPERLALELKEGDAQANSADMAATLDELKRLGVKVTIDDFGRGGPLSAR